MAIDIEELRRLLAGSFSDGCVTLWNAAPELFDRLEHHEKLKAQWTLGVQQYQRMIKELEAEIERLRAALKWEREHYKPRIEKLERALRRIGDFDCDCGNCCACIAREALGEK